MNPKQQQPQQGTFQRALTLLKNGDAETAEKICESALSEFPDDANFLCLSARALLMLSRYDAAVAKY